jgi:hypothetical protein
MIFEMPQEITPSRTAECSAELNRYGAGLQDQNIPLVGVAISGYRLLLSSQR